MNRLILIRHAKSDWSDPLKSDHDRVLNARGRHGAALVGDWLKGKGYVPDQVLCSTAARAVETWDRIAARLAESPAVTFMPDLYHAPEMAMLGILRRATGGTVAMVGHNPGIAEFAALLAAAPPDHPRFDDYPTAATTVFDIRGVWADVAPGRARVVDFVIPAGLGAQDRP